MCRDEDFMSSENVEPQGRQDVCEEAIPDQPSNDTVADRTESPDGLRPGDESAVRGDAELRFNFVESGACNGPRWCHEQKRFARWSKKRGILLAGDPRAIVRLRKAVIHITFSQRLAGEVGYSDGDRVALVFCPDHPGKMGLARAEWFQSRGAVLRFRHSTPYVEYGRVINDGLISCLFRRLGRREFISGVSVAEVVDGGKMGLLFDVMEAEPDLSNFLYSEPEVVSVERGIGIETSGSDAAVNEAVGITGDDLGCLDGDTE